MTGIPAGRSVARLCLLLLPTVGVSIYLLGLVASHPFKLAVVLAFLLALLATWQHQRNVGGAAAAGRLLLVRFASCMFVGKRIKKSKAVISLSTRPALGLEQNGKELGNRFTRHPSLFSLTLSDCLNLVCQHRLSPHLCNGSPRTTTTTTTTTKCFTFPVTMGKNVPLYMFFKAFVNCTPPGVQGETLEISPTMKRLQREELALSKQLMGFRLQTCLPACLPACERLSENDEKVSPACLDVCFLESTMAWWCLPERPVGRARERGKR